MILHAIKTYIIYTPIVLARYYVLRCKTKFFKYTVMVNICKKKVYNNEQVFRTIFF